ncbi:hypothetical protein [Motiliproteus sp. SC1-56]|nr:hypothetical protein [Motiliproteus sp. SC1-56]
MKKGPDLIMILVVVFVIGFVITGVSKTDLQQLASITRSLGLS